MRSGYLALGNEDKCRAPLGAVFSRRLLTSFVLENCATTKHFREIGSIIYVLEDAHPYALKVLLQLIHASRLDEIRDDLPIRTIREIVVLVEKWNLYHIVRLTDPTFILPPLLYISRFFHISSSTGGFALPGYPQYRACVTWNRIRSAEVDKAGNKSQVLIMSGPPEILNEEFLLNYFDDKLIYQLEEIIHLGTIDEGRPWPARHDRSPLRGRENGSHPRIHSGDSV
ncbi:hypothetical protein QBC38DRAFT_504652 [Podospora fimiseda]|uniref:Uncharacterized protein n=1 Tax=Podospora fimiseda TaxID=252190 RepID=A0AAN6YM19_9PEZI|nr:hypothetical protein QBC38DRAFT_504652 [Podospora fimiseda]